MKEILVYIDLQRTSHFVGRLWMREQKGRESASFDYSKDWLNSPLNFPLEPALAIDVQSHHTDKSLFGSIGDSAPDRWGRTLMRRLEIRTAKKENRPVRQLKESDFLLNVSDILRQGALRFKENINRDFCAPLDRMNIPPIIQLPTLLALSEKVVKNEELGDSLKDLMEPGASLGGARPKAVVVDGNHNLLLAKFPSPKDEWDVEAWEYIALNMAKRCGINTPKYSLKKVNGENVLLLDRFDRNKDERIPFLSAMSMLGASDMETDRSYLEIGEALINHGSNTTEDLKNLWKRLVFNIMVSNLDDHLRNHGFLYAGQSGWRLSPIYDLEPTPEHVKSRFLRTNIDFDNNEASLEVAHSVAQEFGLSSSGAREIAKEVADSTKNWLRDARAIGLKKNEIDFMSSAFEHRELDQALRGEKFSGGMWP
jgi:serine/threonine-protein kinase HipA